MASNQGNLPYPLQFDPSQWSNKYSNFAGQSLNPYMGGYSGTPTDARGNPIGSYQAFVAQQQAGQPAAMAPSTTLNSNPFAGVQIPQGQNTAVAEPYGGLNAQQWQALTPQQRGAASAPMAQYSAGLGMMPSGNNFVASGSNPSGANPQASTGLALMNAGASGFNQMAGGQGQGAAAAPGQAPPQSPDMGQAYLNALANPGHVATPGATVPQAALPSQNSNVLQQFLQNWQQGGSPTTGAGNYNNAGFFKALQGGQSA